MNAESLREDAFELQWQYAGTDLIDSPRRAKYKSRLRYGPEGLVLPPEIPIPEPLDLSWDTAMSFGEWKDSGYWVRKGSKSEVRDFLGIPQFTVEQVQKFKY